MDAGDDYIIFNGPDEQFISGRLIGAEGAIGGTYGVMPDLYLAMDAALKSRDLERARALQYAADDIIYTMCSTHANMYAVIKEILRINEGIDIGSVRAPLTPLSAQDMDTVQEAAKKIRSAREKFF